MNAHQRSLSQPADTISTTTTTTTSAASWGWAGSAIPLVASLASSLTDVLPSRSRSNSPARHQQARMRSSSGDYRKVYSTVKQDTRKIRTDEATLSLVHNFKTSSIQPRKTPRKQNLCDISHAHLSGLIEQSVKELDLTPRNQQRWASIIRELSLQSAADIPFVIKLLASARRKELVESHHHCIIIHCSENGSPDDSQYIPGSSQPLVCIISYSIIKINLIYRPTALWILN